MSESTNSSRIFAEKLKAVRARTPHTQKTIANALKMSPGAVAAWESGEGFPKVRELIQLAEILNSTVGELLGETELPAHGLALETVIRAIVRDAVHEEVAALAKKLPLRASVEVAREIQAVRKPESGSQSPQGSPQREDAQGQ